VAAIKDKAIAIDAIEIVARAELQEIEYHSEVSAEEISKFQAKPGEVKRVDLFQHLE
jgi:hypothetical protein